HHQCEPCRLGVILDRREKLLGDQCEGIGEAACSGLLRGRPGIGGLSVAQVCRQESRPFGRGADATPELAGCEKLDLLMELGRLGGIRRITRPVSSSRLCDERQELRREGKESLQERDRKSTRL